MENIVTLDLGKFGFVELVEAQKILKAYTENKENFLGEGITLNMNTQSGFVFLSDEDYNTGMLQDGKILQWFSCPNCGAEGFDLTDTKENDYGFENKPFKQFNGCCSKECEDA